MSVRKHLAVDACQRLAEARERMALETYKLDRVMQLINSAVERGESRVLVEQPPVPLKDTKAAAYLLRHLGTCGYFCTWVQVIAQQVGRENYVVLVVSVVEAMDMGQPLTMLKATEPDGGLIMREGSAFPAPIRNTEELDGENCTFHPFTA